MIKEIISNAFSFLQKYVWAFALAFFVCLFFSKILALIIAGFVMVKILFPYAIALIYLIRDRT